MSVNISGISRVSTFEWYASLVLSPPTPSNEPSPGRWQLQLVSRPRRSEDVGGEGRERERTEPARNHEFVYVGLLGDIAANQLFNIIFNII